MTQGTGMNDLAWYCLRVSPDQRLMEIVAKHLRHLGYVAEIATEQRLRRRHKKQTERTLETYTSAPGYCFLGLRPGEAIPWKKLHECHIIKSFVTLDGQPARLNHHAVMRFLKFEDAGLPGYYRFFKTGSEFAVGDDVIITRGPLIDFQMRVRDVQAGEAIFLLRMLGAEREVRINVNDCIKAEAA